VFDLKKILLLFVVLFSVLFLLNFENVYADFQECWLYDGNQSSCEALSPDCAWMPADENAWCPSSAYGDGDEGCCDILDCAQWDGDYSSCNGADGVALGCTWYNNLGNQEPWCEINAGNYWFFGITNTTNVGCCGQDFSSTGCWSRDNTNETYCIDPNFMEGMCGWDNGTYCPESIGCCFLEAYCTDATTQDQCNELFGSGIPCSWDNSTLTCTDEGFGGYEFDDCIINSGFWNGTDCEMYEYGEGSYDYANDVRCWFADNNQNVCDAIDGCAYCNSTNILDNNSFCYEKQLDWCEGHDPSAEFSCEGGQCSDASSNPMSCENITIKNTCDCGPLPGCHWTNSSSNTGNYCSQGASSCSLDYNNINISGVEIDICEDAGSNESICDQLKQDYFMPCAFNLTGNNECGFDYVGGGGFGGEDKAGDFEFGDLQTSESCNFAGGIWNCIDIDSYGNQDCWCDFMFGQGTEDCDDSCWACEFQSNGIEWDNATAAQNACESSNAAGGNCEWQSDSSAFNNQGWCNFPMMMEMGFSGGGNCDDSCYDCFEESMCSESNSNCTWVNDSFSNNGWCDPTAIANMRDPDLNCLAAWNENECLASTKAEGCHWNGTYVTDPFTDSSIYLCLQNSTSPEICFIPGDEDGDGLEDCSDSECSQDPMCGFGMEGMGDNGLFIPEHLMDSVCFDFDETLGGNQSSCEANILDDGSSFNGTHRGVNGLPEHLNNTQLCFWYEDMGGDFLCDPIFEQHMSGGMDIEKPPITLGTDLDDVSGNDHLDILDVGVHDDPFGENMDMGFTLVNATASAVCEKQGGINNGTYIRYIDSDGNESGGCSASFGSGADYTGYDYKLFLESISNGTDSEINTFAYRCIDSTWTLMQGVVLNTMDDACEMTNCGPPGMNMPGCDVEFTGVNVLVLKKANFGITSNDLRILVATIGDGYNENNVTDEAGPFYYTPGSVDFKMEDCMGFVDMDGDGLTPDQDPDCKYIKQFGYQPFEYDCNDDVDNDGDGDTDENDSDCGNNPLAGGDFSFSEDVTDKSSPKTTLEQKDEFYDGAFIAIDTNEPANLTVSFYSNDSECFQLNETYDDIGETCSESWCDYDDYKSFHGVDITGLDNGTSYYYKSEVCDPSGNCAYSACSNFSTKDELEDFYFGATPPSGYNVTFGSNDITSVATSTNSSVSRNQNLTVSCPESGYSMKFVDIDVKKAQNIDLSDVVCDSDDDVVGMGSDTWNNLVSKLTPDSTQITWDTGGDSITSITNCDENGESCSSDVSDYMDCNISTSSVTCNIPTTLGYSTYKLSVSSGTDTSSEGSSRRNRGSTTNETDSDEDDEDLCDGVVCEIITIDCGDGTTATCTPECDVNTGECGTCVPVCGDGESENIIDSQYIGWQVWLVLFITLVIVVFEYYFFYLKKKK